jgi:flagellar motor switch protein FliN/FliY
LTLDKSVEDPVDLYVGDRLIARGILEEQDGEGNGRLLVRLTQIIDVQADL